MINCTKIGYLLNIGPNFVINTIDFSFLFCNRCVILKKYIFFCFAQLEKKTID